MLSKESYEALRYSDVDHAWRTRQRSLANAREVGDIFSEAWSIWELGEIYRLKGDLENARAADHHWGMSYALSGLGRASLGLGNNGAARDHFKGALQHAKEADELGIALVALAGIAALYAATAEPERAWNLATWVRNHHVSWRETKDMARSVLEATRDSLPEESRVEFQEPIGPMDLWIRVDQLLNEWF